MLVACALKLPRNLVTWAQVLHLLLKDFAPPTYDPVYNGIIQVNHSGEKSRILQIAMYCSELG